MNATPQLGRNIRLAREHADMTQVQLGKAINRSVVTISRLENGAMGTTIETLQSIARATGVDVRDLLSGEPLKPPDLSKASSL